MINKESLKEFILSENKDYKQDNVIIDTFKVRKSKIDIK